MSELWTRALNDLRKQLSEENFETWLKPVQWCGLEGDVLTLKIPNRFYADWISTHYWDVLGDSIRRETGRPKLRVNWEVDETLQERIQAERGRAVPMQELPPAAAQVPLAAELSKSIVTTFNPKYVFETFVVGTSNQLAHAASIAAASSSGKRYNPLFIYGGVGLGKTHLVNAVGHRVLADKPDARVLYLSAERFTNEFIWGLQNQRISEFRERYRQRCDLLLMDDIQFLAGREQTQEEFFHTFNALHHANKQIVVTCDVSPQQIPDMQERLISRFQWGLVADIQAPELDTRVAIVRSKAEQEHITIDDAVALFLAQNIKSNVRELEGALLRLAVKAELLNRPIDLEFARTALQFASANPAQSMTVEDVQRAVCEYFHMRLSDLKSHRRQRSVTHPRMIAMYLCRQRLGASYPDIGERFGGKDHTTVMSAVRKIASMIEEDPQVKAAVEAIEHKLGLAPQAI